MHDFTEAPPLLTADDLADLEFPGPFNEVDVAVAGALVRGACQWHVAPSVETTLVLDTEGGRVLFLPSLHVTEVLSVTDRAGNVLDGWTWSASGMLERTTPWPSGFRAVQVRLRHGLEKVPEDLAAVVADLAGSRAVEAAKPAGLKAKTVGNVSYQYADAPSGNVLEPYGAVLWRYRRT